MHPYLKLRDWIPPPKDMIGWEYLCLNPSPAAVALLEQNPDKINWSLLSRNTSPDAVALLARNPDKINWAIIWKNPAAIDLLRKNWRDVYTRALCSNPSPAAIELYLEIISYPGGWMGVVLSWLNWAFSKTPIRSQTPIRDYLLSVDSDVLSENPAAIHLLKQHPNIIDWKYLSHNPAPGAIELLKQNQDKIDWDVLSSNPAPAAVELLLQNESRICWINFSKNTSPAAIAYLERNPHRIIWEFLSENPAAIDLLERNMDKIDWFSLSYNPSPDAVRLFEKELNVKETWEEGGAMTGDQISNILSCNKLFENPGIFTYDYALMRADPMGSRALHADFVAWWWHPRRVAAFLESGGDIEEIENL